MKVSHAGVDLIERNVGDGSSESHRSPSPLGRFCTDGVHHASTSSWVRCSSCVSSIRPHLEQASRARATIVHTRMFYESSTMVVRPQRDLFSWSKEGDIGVGADHRVKVRRPGYHRLVWPVLRVVQWTRRFSENDSTTKSRYASSIAAAFTIPILTV